jgi:translation initiation factor 4E
MMFRDGIQPMWEDEANARGGKLVLRIPKKGLASHFWEELVSPRKRRPDSRTPT